jgi:hypothetical protein
VALIIIYNHRYEQNIPVLESIYGPRFSDIYHLMPFYTGRRQNVISVYENSYHFQGYVAQGFRDYWRADFTHYFFVADDLLLHPSINEDNFIDFIGLPEGHSFFPGFRRPDRKDIYFRTHDIKGYEFTSRDDGLDDVKFLW